MSREATENAQDILRQAVSIVGPVPVGEADAWHAQVAATALELSTVFNESSDEIKTLERMLDAERTKRIYGTVCAIDKEESSQRAIIGMKTRPHPKWNKKGIDIIRTDRTDSSSAARELANRISSELIGHRVLATVYLEDTGGSDVRVLQHMRDLGEDTSDELTDAVFDEVEEEVQARKSTRGSR